MLENQDSEEKTMVDGVQTQLIFPFKGRFTGGSEQFLYKVASRLLTFQQVYR